MYLCATSGSSLYLTKFPEILDGRVKTLHPIIYAGILAIRKNKKHKDTLNRFNIKPIDIVICNLYPFEETIKKSNLKWQEVIENIDIGGPTLIRAAAKNYKVNNLKLILGDNQISGWLDVNLTRKQPQLTTELSAQHFSLEPITLPELESLSRIPDLGPLKLAAKLTSSGNRLAFENLDLHSSGK